MNVIAITQARIGSTRLPKKVLMPIGDKTLLGLHLERLSKSNRINDLIVATTTEKESDKICEIAKSLNIDYYKGSVNDVLDRYYQVAIKYNPDFVVRVTSDCPLIDPVLVDEVIDAAIISDKDYFSNVLIEDFPDGQDIEVIKMSALSKSWNEARSKPDREHVTGYISDNCDFLNGKLFTAADYPSMKNYNHLRMTVDEAIDLEVIKWLVEELGYEASWKDYVKLMENNPQKLSNSKIVRNEGYKGNKAS